jgi:hypothetical protein
MEENSDNAKELSEKEKQIKDINNNLYPKGKYVTVYLPGFFRTI